ncbi:MAG: hypothetical protein Q7S70_01875 [bacterium]|nr:hypothetical protein [bacterium]
MRETVTVGDLKPGYYDLSLSLRRGEEKRVRGQVVKGKTERHLIARCSPKHSFGPGTVVVRMFDYSSKPKVK